MFSRNIGNLISGIFATDQPNGQSLASKKEVPMQKKPTDPKIHRRAGNVSDSTPFSQDKPAVSKPEPRVPLTTPAVSGDREGTLPAELTLFIPFRKYTFTLNHQILSRIGAKCVNDRLVNLATSSIAQPSVASARNTN